MMKKGGEGGKKREGMGWKKEKKGTSAPFLLFSFLVSFFLVPVSTPFLRFHSLSPFVRFIPFEKHLVPQCVPRTTTSLMGEIQFAFFHSWHPFLGNGEPLLETRRRSKEQCKNRRYPRGKLLLCYSLSICFILYRSSFYPNFDFSLKSHLENSLT